jgi:hypothetical protein
MPAIQVGDVVEAARDSLGEPQAPRSGARSEPKASEVEKVAS